MLQSLAKTKAGIHQNPVVTDSSAFAHANPLCQKPVNFAHRIGVMRFLLHDGRIAAHVHQTDG